MNENRKKREWVKTAAIIFLTVMLLLTFFSNTIQNYSLPEVATQYVQSGTITAKIRGSGTVQSGDPYEVKVTETRKVGSVAVRVGTEVQKGDVLVYLEDTDSNELKAAKEALEAAQDAYNKALLNQNVTVSDISAANNGVSVESYRSQLTVAQNALKAAENDVKAKQDEVDRIQQAISDCNKQISYENSVTGAARERETAAKKALATATSERDEASKAFSTADNAYNDYKIYETVSGGDAGYVNRLRELKEERDSKANLYNSKKDNYEEAVAENQKAEVYLRERESGQAIAYLTGLVADYELEKYNADKALNDAKKNQTQKQETLTELMTKIGNVTGLETYLDAIEKAEKQVEELTAKTTNATITAPISGTVTAINVTAGNDTSAAVPVVVMQPEGKGYTLSFSVTNEQAKRLSPGDKADLVNAWRYDDVQVVLASIKPDPTNPGQNKLLTFDVTGSVVAGQSLSLSVGQKSANYDFIVPNSSIREDNNGKFILIVESKPSPLGTRYTASRVDVEVIASDDTQSAIRGALYGYEFVITTSTKPVEAGKLVRLPN